MAVIARGFDPIDTLLALQRGLERTFERPFGDFGFSGRGVFPPVNVFVENNDHVLRFEVPGVAPQDLQIETQGRTLTLSGRRALKVPEGGSYHRAERPSGEFSRSLLLPADLDLSRARASCANGILTIRVPKKEEAKPKRISVAG
jgi:HSP20 family protein